MEAQSGKCSRARQSRQSVDHRGGACDPPEYGAGLGPSYSLWRFRGCPPASIATSRQPGKQPEIDAGDP